MAQVIKDFVIYVVIENVLAALYHLYRFLNGRFGKRVLRQPYKKIWQVVMWTLFIYLFSTKVVFPILEWWQGVVNYMNYVVWG